MLRGRCYFLVLKCCNCIQILVSENTIFVCSSLVRIDGLHFSMFFRKFWFYTRGKIYDIGKERLYKQAALWIRWNLRSWNLVPTVRGHQFMSFHSDHKDLIGRQVTPNRRWNSSFNGISVKGNFNFFSSNKNCCWSWNFMNILCNFWPCWMKRNIPIFYWYRIHPRT